MDASEIRQKDFARRFRGYDALEVNTFLEQVAEYLGALQNQTDSLRRQAAALKGELKDYHGREQTLEATLNQTREVAEEIKINAEREAQLMVAEAELQAEKILSQAHTRLAQIHDDIAELKRQRAQFEVRLRSLVEAHLKILDVETDRDRDLAELEDKIRILRSPNGTNT
jgi:cell division initiation protein